MTRPSSLEKPEVTRLANDGVKIVAADLAGAEEDLVKNVRRLGRRDLNRLRWQCNGGDGSD